MDIPNFILYYSIKLVNIIRLTPEIRTFQQLSFITNEIKSCENIKNILDIILPEHDMHQYIRNSIEIDPMFIDKIYLMPMPKQLKKIFPHLSNKYF